MSQDRPPTATEIDNAVEIMRAAGTVIGILRAALEEISDRDPYSEGICGKWRTKLCMCHGCIARRALVEAHDAANTPQA